VDVAEFGMEKRKIEIPRWKFQLN